ncbi:hypothetical protein CEXT_347061 [Caerostris extrusa]|uniref:Uncharacterized protein n=1 Tax=Caerostris extrusa TaxID=172846 RepID=A0AAV4V046_CAEEX|nr:hypothetical protein CEXT_347061 [Caerostris extrusa]
MPILPEAVVPVNTTMGSSTSNGICQDKLVPYCRRKFGTNRQGWQDRGSNSGGNHQAGDDLPLQALSRVAPGTSPSNQLLQEDQVRSEDGESSDETPDTSMEAEEDIPNIKFISMLVVYIPPNKH